MADSNFDIWRLQSNSDVRGLIEATRHGTPDVRRRAIMALRVLGASSAIPGLQSILVIEKEPEIRAMLVDALDYLFQQEVDEDDDQAAEHQSRVVHLIAQLNSDHPEQVIRAAQNLGELKEKIATESLVMIFHNRQLSTDVRLAVAEALIKLESAPVEVSLLAALRGVDSRHRRNAAAVLGQLSADWAVRPLANALRDEQDIVRRTAYAALKRIGTPDALKAIQPPEMLPAPIPAVPQKVETSAAVLPSPLTEGTDTSNPTPPVIMESVSVEQVVSNPPTSPPLVPETSLPVETPMPPEPLALSPLEADAPVDDEDTQPSAPTILPDDVS